MTNLYIRDCHQQVKSVRRLLCQLQDDLGDLSINRDNEHSKRHAEMCDRVAEVESELSTFQQQLATQSRGEG